MNYDLLKGFYLGDLRVDPGSGYVTRDGEQVHLSPKAVEVLLCLASSPGELVTREELLEKVWGPGLGGRDALSHVIGDIRRALRDNPDNPTYIQTLPRRGYRLIATVEALGESAEVVFEERKPESAISSGLLDDLLDRGVVATGVAYLPLGWLLIQIADIVFEQFGLPAIAATAVTMLVIGGFPIALLLSWYLEIRGGKVVAHSLSPSLHRRRRISRAYLSVITAMSIAGLLVFLYERSIGLPLASGRNAGHETVADTLPPIQKNSIAVLRFANLDESDRTEIFANGLADDMISLLSRVPGLLVSARGDSLTLDPNSTSARVRERLRVAHYVGGSVQIEGDVIRVVVQLIDSIKGFHIMSRSFDRPLESYFSMRDEITALTVANLRPALPPETRAMPTVALAHPDIDVYMLYRRGIDASRQPDIESSMADALKWFNAALEIDPEFAAAHAGKCDVHVEAYDHTNDSNHIALAEKSCATALALNPNLDVTYVSLGDLYTITGRYDLAEKAYIDALEIDPGNALALVGLGEVYRLLQRPDEAESSLRRAIGLHPGNWATYNQFGTFLFRSGRYAEASEQFRNLVALDDRNSRGLTNLASALVLAEEFEQAEPVFKRALDLEPSARTYTNLGMLKYNLGKYGEAVTALQDAVAMVDTDYLVRSNLGDALNALGQHERAREEFVRARILVTEASEVNRNDPFIMMDWAWIEAALGNRGKARELINGALDAVPDDPYVHYIDGLVKHAAGESSGALDALERAVELGYSKRLLANDPILSSLRRDPRYLRLVQDTG